MMLCETDGQTNRNMTIALPLSILDVSSIIKHNIRTTLNIRLSQHHCGAKTKKLNKLCYDK